MLLITQHAEYVDSFSRTAWDNVMREAVFKHVTFSHPMVFNCCKAKSARPFIYEVQLSDSDEMQILAVSVLRHSRMLCISGCDAAICCLSVPFE